MSQQPQPPSSQQQFGGSSGQASQSPSPGQSQSTGSQRPLGQMGQQPGQAGGQVPPGTAAVATAIAEAVEVCGYCADQCIREANPNMVECIRLCEDVTELGEAALALVSRDSRYAGSILHTFQQAAEACAQECSHHPAGHCQTCASVLGETTNTIRQFASGSRQF